MSISNLIITLTRTLTLIITLTLSLLRLLRLLIITIIIKRIKRPLLRLIVKRFFFCLCALDDFLAMLFAVFFALLHAFLASGRVLLHFLLIARLIVVEHSLDQAPDNVQILIKLRHFANAASGEYRLHKQLALFSADLCENRRVEMVVEEHARQRFLLIHRPAR